MGTTNVDLKKSLTVHCGNSPTKRHMRITTLAFLLATATASAQVTIGQNEMPHAGDALLKTRAVSNPFLNYGATGANYTWNFTNLVAQAQETRSYQSVSSTNIVYALIYVDLFFNPNRANHATEGVDIPFNQLLPIDNPYTFYLHTGSQYKKVGYGAEIAGIPLPITFNQQDVVYELPLNYGNTSSSTSFYQLAVPNLAYYGYGQERTNDVDGWGAITTPAGTYDVLRVHTVLNGKDSINIDTLSLGFAVERPAVHEYKWLAPGFRVPILQINTTELFGTEVITDVWFYDEPRSIEVVAPLAATLCAGGEYTLTYDENGSYNPGGFLIPANVFTAQLSDENGDFANATNIGTVTSTQSGTITVTIPANTPAGTGYRIRVNANSPATTGTDNGFDITIQPGTLPVASASAGGPTTFCDGGDVTLSAGTDPNYTYQWLLDGTAIPGATDPDLLAGEDGTYSVEVSNVCGNDVSTDIDVTVNALPVNELDATSYASCEGTAVTITAVDQSGLNNLDYVWTLDGNVIPGADQSSISATDAGAYAVEVTDSQTGCAYTSASAVLAIEAIPVVTVSAQGSTTFCADGSVVLDAGNDPDLSYQWFLDGNAINGATASTLTADSTGTYTVVATSTGGCASDPSNSTDVTENPIPAEPVITQGTDTLYASGTGDFQWNLFGSPINGATDAFIETAISGDYTVTVTVNGCSSTSAIYTYIATGVDVLDQSAVQVFPNPSAGAFTIQLTKGGAQYAVTDMTGKLVQQGLLNGVQNTLDLGTYGTGMYILRITQDGASRSVRLMRN